MIHNLVEFVIKVCPTKCNRVADGLAAYGCSALPYDEAMIWCPTPNLVTGGIQLMEITKLSSKKRKLSQREPRVKIQAKSTCNHEQWWFGYRTVKKSNTILVR